MVDAAGPGDARVSDADVATAKSRIKAGLRGTIPASLAVSAIVQIFATWLVTSQAGGLGGMTLGLWITAVTVAILTPLVFIVAMLASRDTIRQLSQSLARERELRDEAKRREFETRLTNALDMADTEHRVMTVAGRALSNIAGQDRAEVLLADNSHAHLHPALVSGPD